MYARRFAFDRVCATVMLVAACGMTKHVALAESPLEDRNPYAEYRATIMRVIDGDTITVAIDLWPGLVANYAVRIRGIDAPELRGPGCPEEKAWAIKARKKAELLYDPGSLVQIRNVEYDAFSGRVVADVYRWRSDRWLSFAEEMIQRKLAVEWSPDLPDVPWCLLAQDRE